MEQNRNNFFDKKTVTAVVLTGAVFLGWQRYLTTKYPSYGKPTTAKTVEKGAEQIVNEPKLAANTEIADADKTNTENKISPEQKNVSNKLETLINIDNSEYSLDISSKGLGIKNLVLKKYTDRDKKNIQLGQSSRAGLFELRIAGHPVDFETVSSESAGTKTIVGLAKMGAMTVRRVLTLSPNYYLSSVIEIKNPSADFKQFEILIPEHRIEGKSGNFLAPATDFQLIVLKNEEKIDRVNLTTSKEDVVKSEGLQKVFGVSSHYFATGFANKSEITPEVFVDSKAQDSELSAAGVYKIVSPTSAMTFEGAGYFGPKDLKIMESVLESTNADFTHFVDFGFFGFIGRILLKILQFVHQHMVANWGVAIILLTLLVRLLVFPFNAMSFKSMKKMQLVQPQIASLRERYKSDSQTLNTEMMKLMKDQKVNPLGGCLPMLLQMPVFFALYQVLGQSIDLYQAPFFGWIQDLSLKDPLFVTPALMGLAMWYNQKITPNTMDPAQAKMMQFLPLVFSFMMIALPSGLTLYIFVSTIFGIVQQQIFMKDRSKTVKV